MYPACCRGSQCSEICRCSAAGMQCSKKGFLVCPHAFSPSVEVTQGPSDAVSTV